jgi:hypothetical protein
MPNDRLENMMDMWNDDEWPINIRQRDEEQKPFHKSVTSAFLHILDSNDATVTINTLYHLCSLLEPSDIHATTISEYPETGIQDTLDDSYGNVLDITEGLKISLSHDENHGDDFLNDTLKDFSEFMEASASTEDDFDIPQFGSTERRGSKPS